MTYLIIILMSIGFARAVQTFNLPDIKPFNCQSCLSFWNCVLIMAFVDYELIGIALISYLFSDILLIWESKR